MCCLVSCYYRGYSVFTCVPHMLTLCQRVCWSMFMRISHIGSHPHPHPHLHLHTPTLHTAHTYTPTHTTPLHTHPHTLTLTFTHTHTPHHTHPYTLTFTHHTPSQVWFPPDPPCVERPHSPAVPVSGTQSNVDQSEGGSAVT